MAAEKQALLNDPDNVIECLERKELLKGGKGEKSVCLNQEKPCKPHQAEATDLNHSRVMSKEKHRTKET